MPVQCALSSQLVTPILQTSLYAVAHYTLFTFSAVQYALSSELVTLMGRVADGLNGLLAGEVQEMN